MPRGAYGPVPPSRCTPSPPFARDPVAGDDRGRQVLRVEALGAVAGDDVLRYVDQAVVFDVHAAGRVVFDPVTDHVRVTARGYSPPVATQEIACHQGPWATSLVDRLEADPGAIATEDAVRDAAARRVVASDADVGLPHRKVAEGRGRRTIEVCTK